MKKAAKGIIGLSAALVVLGGGLAALKFTDTDDQTEEEESSSVSETSGSGITLVEDTESSDGTGTVSRVNVVNPSGELNVIIATEATDDASATYTLDGYEDISLNTSVVGTLANNADGLTSQSIVAEDCTDTDKYGFDEPQATVEVIYESGSSVTFIIGDIAPTSSETYLMIDGDDTIYTVSTSTMSNYSKELFDFVSTTILEEPDDDDYPIVNSLRIQRDDIDYDIYLEYDTKSDDVSYTGGTSATHVMMEPTFAYLSVDDSTTITNGMFGLTASEIYGVHVGEAEIAEAGLSEPFCTVTMSCDDGNDYVLYMSEPFTDENADKYHYVMLEGGNVIYTVSAEDAQWGTVMPIDIASKILFGTYVWNISEMTVNCSGLDEINFEITMKDDVEDTDSLSSDDFNVTKNGSVFDAERYREFYAFLVQASAEDFALDETVPDEAPMVTIEFYDSYTNVSETVEFYDYSSLTALIVVDGECKFFCGKSYVETIIENAERIDTGEDYITTWK
ncbi:MAG: DUF4340 domain-containing protein [Ruminococcus sp.]|nr:DUF4340 domain-containing protein [Ruminococcus sp.]